MHGAGKPRIVSYPAGATLLRQGTPGTEVYLVLDGVVRVERNGEPLADYGPGAMLGERAHLEGGRADREHRGRHAVQGRVRRRRTLERSALAELSGMHRREEA